MPKIDRKKALLATRLNLSKYNDRRRTLENRIEFGINAMYYMTKFNLSEEEVRGTKGKNWVIPEWL